MGLWISQNYEKSVQGAHRAPSTKERASLIFWCAGRTLHFCRPSGAGTIARRTSGLSCGRTAEGGGPSFSNLRFDL